MDIWIPTTKAIIAMGVTKQAFHKARRDGKFRYRFETVNGGEQTMILLSDLPEPVQMRYWQMENKTAPAGETKAQMSDTDIYASAPEHARKKADKYLALIKRTGGLSGNALRVFIAGWNNEHPTDRTSYPRLLDARKQYKAHGIAALLGKWGKRSGASSVDDELYTFFKSLYMIESRPSAYSCWKIMLGFAQEHCHETSTIPSHNAFVRRLEKEVPKSAIYAARYGAHAANGRYGFYVKRDMSDVLAGECWVFDHAQIDVAVFYKDAKGNEKVAFPWVTVARDYKSGKWLGWDLFIGGPNSDNVFMAYYRAAIKWGTSGTLYLDNGKDFRCKNFSGGRTPHRLEIDEVKTTSMTAVLGVNVIFAWPYNAQAKPVERDFNRNKEWFSKHSPGYRGGNVVERPDSLNDTIAAHKIMTFEQLEKLWPLFVDEVINKTEISSGYRKDDSPDEIFAREYPVAMERELIKHRSKDSLRLFCTRTSQTCQLGRRGFHDSKYDVDYYDSWMEGQKGRKVYLRRDPMAMQDAWVFDAESHEYLGQGYYLPLGPGLAKTDIQKADLADAIGIKRTAEKALRAFTRTDIEVPFDAKITYMAQATKILNDQRGAQDTIAPIQESVHVTPMDHVAAKRKRLDEEGTQDISAIMKNLREGVVEKRKIYTWESEMQDAQKVG